MATTQTALARQSITAFNSADWQGMRDLIAPGYVYQETGTGRRISDIDELITALQAWRAALPDASGEVLRVSESGDTTVMEIRWTGTHDGPLDLGTSILPASGRPTNVLATIWQRWKDGKVVEERNHLDLLTMLAQVGVADASAFMTRRDRAPLFKPDPA